MTASRDKLTVAAGLICMEFVRHHWLRTTELQTSAALLPVLTKVYLESGQMEMGGDGDDGGGIGDDGVVHAY